MLLDFVSYLILCPLIFLSGLLDSIAGGGGVISIPAYMLAGLSPHHAIGTNKVSVAIGCSASIVRYASNKMINYKIAVIGALCSVAGSVIGARLVLLVSDQILNYMMIIILPAVAVFTLTNKKLTNENTAYTQNIPSSKLISVYVAIFLLGIYSGFYGPGHGTFVLLALVQIGGMPASAAAATARFINLGGVLGALTVFLINGQSQIITGLIAGAFCLLGNYIGSGLVVKNGAK